MFIFQIYQYFLHLKYELPLMHILRGSFQFSHISKPTLDILVSRFTTIVVKISVKCRDDLQQVRLGRASRWGGVTWDCSGENPPIGLAELNQSNLKQAKTESILKIPGVLISPRWVVTAG